MKLLATLSALLTACAAQVHVLNSAVCSIGTVLPAMDAQYPATFPQPSTDKVYFDITDLPGPTFGSSHRLWLTFNVSDTYRPQYKETGSMSVRTSHAVNYTSGELMDNRKVVYLNRNRFRDFVSNMQARLYAAESPMLVEQGGATFMRIPVDIESTSNPGVVMPTSMYVQTNCGVSMEDQKAAAGISDVQVSAVAYDTHLDTSTAGAMHATACFNSRNAAQLGIVTVGAEPVAAFLDKHAHLQVFCKNATDSSLHLQDEASYPLLYGAKTLSNMVLAPVCVNIANATAEKMVDVVFNVTVYETTADLSSKVNPVASGARTVPVYLDLHEATMPPMEDLANSIFDALSLDMFGVVRTGSPLPSGQLPTKSLMTLYDWSLYWSVLDGPGVSTLPLPKTAREMQHACHAPRIAMSAESPEGNYGLFLSWHKFADMDEPRIMIGATDHPTSQFDAPTSVYAVDMQELYANALPHSLLPARRALSESQVSNVMTELGAPSVDAGVVLKSQKSREELRASAECQRGCCVSKLHLRSSSVADAGLVRIDTQLAGGCSPFFVGDDTAILSRRLPLSEVHLGGDSYLGVRVEHPFAEMGDDVNITSIAVVLGKSMSDVLNGNADVSVVMEMSYPTHHFVHTAFEKPTKPELPTGPSDGAAAANFSLAAALLVLLALMQ